MFAITPSSKYQKKDQEYFLNLACWQKTKHSLIVHIMYFSRFSLFAKYSDKILVFHQEFNRLESYLSSFAINQYRSNDGENVELYAAVSRSSEYPKNVRQKNSVLRLKLNSERFLQRLGKGNISIPDVRLIYPTFHLQHPSPYPKKNYSRNEDSEIHKD